MASTIKRTECSACGSKNNLCWFTNDKGYLTSKCMTPDCNGPEKTTKEVSIQMNINTNNELITTGRYEALEDRGISEETCRKYLVQVGELNGKKIHIYNYTDKHNNIVSQKIRFVDTKEFIWRQNTNEKQLFGNINRGSTDKRIWICEGELDCLSLAEVGISNTGSISAGAGDQTVTEIKRHLEFLEQFEKIVLVFDNDKVGQGTAREIAKLFTPGKCYIAKLRNKDPNEYLQKGMQKELLEDLEAVELYKPDMIVPLDMDRLLTAEQHGLDLPYPELNKWIKGLKPGRIYTLLAGSGAGKTTFTRELVHYLVSTSDIKAGAIYLEEPVKTTALGFIALEANVPLHELEDNPTLLNGEFKPAYDKFIGSGRIQFVDASFMRLEGKELLYTLNYLAVGLGCKVLILDHLSMITYDMQGENSERKDIDMLMKSLRELTHKTGCSIILVSHLKRPPMGKSWAEGREVNMTDSRGSASIEQLSDVILGLERNMLSETEKNKTRLKVLKNRITGRVGYCDDLYYEEKTGRLITIGQLFK